jgi:hypothetical protein
MIYVGLFLLYNRYLVDTNVRIVSTLQNRTGQCNRRLQLVVHFAITSRRWRYACLGLVHTGLWRYTTSCCVCSFVWLEVGLKVCGELLGG